MFHGSSLSRFGASGKPGTVQIQEPRPGRHVGDVGDPQTVGGIGLKLTLDPVRSRTVAALRTRGARPPVPAHPDQAGPHASAEPRACDSPGIPGDAARHGPEAPHRCLRKPCGWSGSCRATPRRACHDWNAHGLATRSTRWRRRPALGTSWPPDDGPDSPSRARRPPRYRAGLPSKPGRGFFYISRSSRSWRFSRRSRRSSSSSKLVRPSSRRPSSRSV